MQLPETNPARVVTLTQQHIAITQLERAVLLFLNERDFVSSVTLACAAEGILGEHLKERGIKPHADELKAVLQNKFVPHLSLRQINDEYVNRARNFFKHKVCDLNEFVEFEPETEAICAIVRATHNAALVTEAVPDVVVSFFTWLKAHRPELTDTNSIEHELGL